MVSENELKEYRAIIERIIDKHIPEEKRFSVEKFNQEQIWYLTRILLAKTQEEREEIRKEIKDKQKLAEKNLLKNVEDIKKYKENFDTIFSSINDIRSLKKNMDLDSKLDTDLDSTMKK
jgi:hypothetical protein